MWLWLVSKIIQPFLPFVLGGLLAFSLVGTVGGYIKGRSDMNKYWVEKNLENTIAMQKETIARYEKSAEADKKQFAQELQDSQDQAKAIAERVQQAIDEEAATEAELSVTITDKEKLDAALKALRAKCIATPADVSLDQRLRGDKQRR